MRVRFTSLCAALAAITLFVVADAVRADEPPATATAPATSTGMAAASTGTDWPLPPPGSCQPPGGLIGSMGGPPDDAAAVPFKTGDVFTMETMEALANFIPEFIWEYRDRFFHEGMRLEIGPCFADYGAPAFYDDATAKFAGQAQLTAEGGLDHYTAGLPFPPEAIAKDAPDAGMRWLWNTELRYQAAGFRGDFRMTDLVGRIGRAEPFEGEMFRILFAHRADRAADGYLAPGSRGNEFVAGGLFFKPFDAREYAWRQYRDLAHMTQVKRSDDLYAYLPQWRRVRRISANQVEGLYMPSFSVGVVPNQQIAGAGGAGTGGVAAGGIGAAGGVGGMGGTIQNKRSGYEGLVIRPLLYRTRVLGLHDVLAPINISGAMYPANPDRDFGPWGLSFADDRWDLRRALVLEMTARKGALADQELSARQILYVDLETLQPLYVATFDRKDERTNVGMYSFRWSEDREDYEPWPDDPDRPIRVLDSVGASFANLAESGSWRRESWDNLGTPPSDREVKRMVSVNELTKRR